MWYTTWTWVTTTSILPFLTLLGLNLIIYRRLKQARAVQVSARLQSGQLQSQVRPHTAEQSLTLTSALQSCPAEKTNLSSSSILLCTVATFLVCHSPRSTIYSG